MPPARVLALGGIVIAAGRLVIRAFEDRRNIQKLADHLRIPLADAARLYQRSREVGYGAARDEFERGALTPTETATRPTDDEGQPT